MKSIAPLLLSLSILAYVPFSWIFTGNAGNPDKQPYVGQAGSMYDLAANPPQASGTVSYNPTAPLPADPAIQQKPQTNPAPKAN